MSASSVIAVGLPKAGKSTFIAALAYILQHGEIETDLQLSSLSEDMSYINMLIADWLRCKSFERSPAGVQHITFSLRDSSGPRGDVIFPDISGETYNAHWELREWESNFGTLVQSANGLLMFVHPENLEKPFSVVDVARVAKAAEALSGEDDDDEPEETAKASSAAVWHPSLAASQVKLVDFLQMIMWNTGSALPLRLGIVISAWDLILKTNPSTSPELWLKQAAPYLHQFLTCNPESYTVRIYGVSAQGGDNKADAEALRALNEPSKRVKVVGIDCREHDITAPLKWVLTSNG